MTIDIIKLEIEARREEERRERSLSECTKINLIVKIINDILNINNLRLLSTKKKLSFIPLF